jgi:sugar O-acyltransferase (sialic acid O-acetyltransferase NeuD family)
MDDLILFGGGGHCRSCIDVIESEGRFRIAGIVDVKEKLGQQVLGYEIIATEEDLPGLTRRYGYFFITIGQIKSPDIRIKQYETLQGFGMNLPVIISPMAYVSQHSTIGDGTIVMHNAFVNAGASIGKNCIINTGAIIEHDVEIGDHCHISTGALVNGGTKIGMKTFFGSNSSTVQYIEIGEDSIIASGVSVPFNLSSGTFLKRQKAQSDRLIKKK